MLQGVVDVAIRADNFDEAVDWKFDYVGILADYFTSELIRFLLFNRFHGTDGHHSAQNSQIYRVDIFGLIFCHVLGVL